MKIELTHSHVTALCQDLGGNILSHFGAKNDPRLKFKVYGVPRGGVPVAYMLAALYPEFIEVADLPTHADFFADDIIDSGATKAKYAAKYPGIDFFGMIDKLNGSGNEFKDSWIVFPWERGDEKETEGIEDNITRLLQFIGEDPKRGGLLDTPKRVAKAWRDWSAGYGIDIPALLKTFEDGADGCDEMVVVKDIPFYTHCEHHMAPFFGTATIAYIPDGKIVGLSKLPRVVNAFARRLQVQERLTNQIADAIHDNLQPKGVGVVIRARHLCMESRGIQQQGHHTITSALRGVMRDSAEARAEFLDLAR
jgi:GTP cyclohydrolase I